MFKPKYGAPIVNKVLKCFVEDYLDWYSNGYDWHIRKVDSKHEGWWILEVWPEESSSYFGETSFIEEPITNKQLTDTKRDHYSKLNKQTIIPNIAECP